MKQFLSAHTKQIVFGALVAVIAVGVIIGVVVSNRGGETRDVAKSNSNQVIIDDLKTDVASSEEPTLAELEESVEPSASEEAESIVPSEETVEFVEESVSEEVIESEEYSEESESVAFSEPTTSSQSSESSESVASNEPTTSSEPLESSEPTTPSEPSQPSETIDEYYANNSTIIKIVDATTSPAVPTEAQVVDLLTERGFVGYPVTYEYEMGGVYVDDVEISQSADVKRPMYTTYFVSEAGEFWTIYVINGSIFANPVSYNMNSERTAQLLISESEQLTSYESNTNKYYVTIPNEDAAIVRVVEKIDADSLNKLTVEEIDKL